MNVVGEFSFDNVCIVYVCVLKVTHKECMQVFAALDAACDQTQHLR